MVDFDLSVRIDADPELVYAVLTDVQRYATGPGSPVLMTDKAPPGPTRAGTRWREVVHVGPLLNMTMWSQVTECAVGRCLQMDFHGGGMRGWLRYTPRHTASGRDDAAAGGASGTAGSSADH